MSNNLNYDYKKYMLPLIKLLALTMLIVGSTYTAYNALQLKKLSESIVNDFNQLYSISRRFAQYYNNTDMTFLEKGTHVRNGVSIMVSKDSEVKVLSKGINKLRSQFETIAPNHIWTVAIFEHPSAYGHFDPLRKAYADRYSEYKANDVMNRIIKTESLEDTYSQFYGCNIKLSEPYAEPGTDQIIRTIFYPVYNQGVLNALLAVDIKNSFIDYQVNKFNDEYWTAIDTKAHWLALKLPIKISCTNAEPIYVGFGFGNIFERIFAPSVFIALFGHILMLVYKRNKQRFYKDRMTGFYRRDFYEPRLKKQQNFSLLVIDIDFFKSINDALGHKVGDDVISEVTRRIASQIRSSDAAIRWGGEEFVISFRNMDEQILREKAEAIRACIIEHSIEGLNVTVSIGGVHLEDSTFAEAFRIADEALYQSKQNGRNRVTF
ncbi:GGDEF domain-containing protein [Vibrio taketomensis]|uniref:GGDEF domain-containing protein n=1 Tax=Vibrio taketomensis TaxID=2572923 RepID=UPI00138A678C|nr:GGDEF domain-containing protein [Vibrio taketomensis]